MKNILKYQEIDMELDRLNRQKNAFEELKVIERMKNIVKNAQKQKGLFKETTDKVVIL